MTAEVWRGKSVFVTGHTGFKGGWLCLVLQAAGAEVHGFSLEPPTTPNLFTEARIGESLAGHEIGDVRDRAALGAALARATPEVVFHLAAQPLVRRSYVDPVETYAVNVMGSVNLLDAVRACPSVRTVVNVTTDKCYENREWAWGYREPEPLGGRDPYSSSKACSELVTAAYRSSFFNAGGAAIASARAGNVIGGGDWAEDRLLPDFFRAADAGVPLQIRFPDAIRPWQHVLEPVSGYVRLAECMMADAAGYSEPWNFGPGEDDARPVRWILDRLCERHSGVQWIADGGEHFHEAHFLRLDSSKARARLGWRPRWDLEQAIGMTSDWHARWRAGRNMREVSLDQVAAHDRACAA